MFSPVFPAPTFTHYDLRTQEADEFTRRIEAEFRMRDAQPLHPAFNLPKVPAHV